MTVQKLILPPNLTENSAILDDQEDINWGNFDLDQLLNADRATDFGEGASVAPVGDREKQSAVGDKEKVKDM